MFVKRKRDFFLSGSSHSSPAQLPSPLSLLPRGPPTLLAQLARAPARPRPSPHAPASLLHPPSPADRWAPEWDPPVIPNLRPKRIRRNGRLRLPLPPSASRSTTSLAEVRHARVLPPRDKHVDGLNTLPLPVDESWSAVYLGVYPR